MDTENLYISVRRRICKLIFDGVYPEGTVIPPERILAENLGVSRVTLRKALRIMEKDHVIERVQGSGTTVRLRTRGYCGTMDIITLVAPAQNPFFSSFIESFQQTAESNGSLVLYKQKPPKESIDECLYKLFDKDLRNVVLWLDDLKISGETLRKLRGLGMNVVLFDTVLKTPYADCVYLDNFDAIRQLCNFFHARGIETLAYMGWDNRDVFSVTEREAAFREQEPEGMLLPSVPWSGKDSLIRIAHDFASDLRSGEHNPEAIVFGDGEIGIAFARALRETGWNMPLGTVDEFPGAGGLSLTAYAQNFPEISQKTYDCLRRQNIEADTWQASVHPIPGYLRTPWETAPRKLETMHGVDNVKK